jgi:pyruvate formate lyase activating enzyme
MANPVVYAPSMLPLSLCDYIGEPACVIFFSGCNLQCGYCQNWQLRERSEEHAIPVKRLVENIRGNPLINACKVTGGEPLLQFDALRALGESVRALGLKFGIDTNGTLPNQLESLLPCLDLVSLDVKTALNEAEYRRMTGSAEPCVKAVKRSLEVLLHSNTYADIRMVVVPGLNDSEHIIKSVANSLVAAGYTDRALRGKASFTLVEFVPDNVVLEPMKARGNTPASQLTHLAQMAALENMRITHRAVGFFQKVQ